MRLLDLFCGAGGAAAGYHRAGFEIIGVDIAPQKHFPFEFMQHDAIELLNDIADYGVQAVLEDAFGPIDVIHASPPCQDHSPIRHAARAIHGTGWMLATTRELLLEQELPWIIENVPGAPMRADYKLCGCMFDLPRLRRERWFETSWHGFDMRAPCHHVGPAVTVAGHGAQGGSYERWNGELPDQEDRKRAMGIDWMNRDELSQAIPPAYTEYIGEQVLTYLSAVIL